MAKQWVDITTINNTTPFMKVRWKWQWYGSQYDSWFAEAPGLVTDGKRWNQGNGDWGWYSAHRLNNGYGGSYVYCCSFDFDRTSTAAWDVRGATYRVSVKDTNRNATGFYDTAVTIDGETYYEIDFSLWRGAEGYQLYAPYSTMPWHQGDIYVYVGTDDLVIDKDNVDFTGEGGNDTINITAETSWSASTSDNWITLSPASGESGVSAISVAVASNPSSSSTRTGGFTLTNGNETLSVSVSQERAMPAGAGGLFLGGNSVSGLYFGGATVEACYLGTQKVYPGSFSGVMMVPSATTIYENNVYTMTVYATEPWTLTYDNKISCSPASGATGVTDVTVSALTKGQSVITATTSAHTATSTVNIESYADKYLTIELIKTDYLYYQISTAMTASDYLIDYRINGGEWTTISIDYTGSSYNYGVIGGKALQPGTKVELRGVRTTYYGGNGNYCSIDGRSNEGTFNVYGNINSLIVGDDFNNPEVTPQYGTFTFYNLFYSTPIVDASNLVLPAMKVEQNGYRRMFYYCTNLTKAPKLPATDVRENGYMEMFYNCTSLTTAPDLPAQTSYSQMYKQMFGYCTSLNSIRCLLAERNASNCTYNWVIGVPTTTDGKFTAKTGSSWTRGNSGIPINWTILYE